MALFVRDLKIAEGQKIQYILRKSTRRMAVRRAQVILMSAQAYTVKEIALQTLMHPEYVRELIRRFNKEGVAIFTERPRSGRPIEFTEEVRADIMNVALAPPKLLGLPFTKWSLAKLSEHLVKVGIVKNISIETLRTILKEQKIRLQRTKTWKESNDPEFDVKKNA
jgi:transposase